MPNARALFTDKTRGEPGGRSRGVRSISVRPPGDEEGAKRAGDAGERVGLECSDPELRSESTGDDQRRADQSERDEWPGPWRRRMFRFEF